MASSSNPSEDPLTAALHEAEILMESLDATEDGGDEVNIGSFQIDSDGEEDLAAEGAVQEKDASTSAAANLHPLHDDFLNSATPPAPTGSTAPTPPPPPVVNSYSTSFSVGGFQTVTPPNSTATSSTSGSFLGSSTTAAAAAPSMDAFKQQTSRFATNLAGFAQRAANQVSTAVGTTPTAAANVLGGGSSFASTPPQYQINATPPSAATATGNFSSPTVNAAPAPELDAEQKKMLIQTHVGDLIPGERVIMFLSNLLHVSDSTGFQYNTMQSGRGLCWCCAMTYYRIILFATHPVSSAPPKPADWNTACWPQHDKSILQMPLASMEKVEKTIFTATSATNGFGNLTVGAVSSTASNTASTTLMGLVCHGKHNGRQLRFTTSSYADTGRAYDALQNYAFPGRRNLGYLFAFESKREHVMASIETDAVSGKKTVTLEPFRKRFDGVAEFQRQLANAGGKQQQGPWSIWTTTNASYQLCMSYPSILAGPTSLDETINPDAGRLVRQCAAFRSEGRLPALTWCTTGGASIWRCAQPKIGLQGNRSSADELFLKHIAEGAASANAMNNNNASHQIPPRSVLVQLTGSPDLSNWLVPNSNNISLKILDLRPRSAAMANRTGGYGYENTSNYPGSTLQFCNIGNIHAVRDSYQKLSQLCLSSVSSDLQFAAAVEDTKWLSHIRLIWSAAWETAYWVHVQRLPVLLHCSHGWDRTSQVAVLAQLLLDPYYRTMEGFACLVEKDFLAFGHPFHTRCGHGEGKDGAGSSSTTGAVVSSAVDEGQISPIFLQFLDCVFQIVNQYPECFEFNTKYVLCLSEHIYSCRFGNFLCDTERERELVAGIRQRTDSIWDYLDHSNRKDMLNAQFSPEVSAGVMLMPLPTLLRNITLWTDRHCVHGPKPTTRWLPKGVERPAHPLNNDQPTDLVTEQENQQLILKMPESSVEANHTGQSQSENHAADTASATTSEEPQDEQTSISTADAVTADGTM